MTEKRGLLKDGPINYIKPNSTGIKIYIAAARDKRVPTRLGVNSYGNHKENRDQESGNEGEDKEKATQEMQGHEEQRRPRSKKALKDK